MAGRKPLPTQIKVLKGTAQKCRMNPREPIIDPSIPPPPDVLGDVGRQEWLKKAPILYRMGVLSDADDAALAAYCLAYERMVDAETKLKQSGLLIKTSNGNVIQNPLISISNRAMELMHKFLTEFGMSPVSRTRVSAKEPGAKVNKWANL